MKNKFTLTAVTFLLAVSAFAQITLTSADMPTVGWTQPQAKDTLPLPVINYGNPGANQIYDFSTLQPYSYDTLHYLALTAGQQTNFPNADVAVTADNVNYLYTRTTAAKFDWEGIEGYLPGTTLYTTANFNPVADIYHFPTQYGGNFTGTYQVTKTVSGASVGQPTADSVRLTLTTTFFDTIDGWGTVITPTATYNCLREKRVNQNHTLVEARLIFPPNYFTVSDKRDTNTRYSYPTHETKGTAITFDYDTLGNIIDAVYSLVPAASVNMPPVAMDDMASTLQPSPVTVNVAANDTDSDGDSLCVTAVYGNTHFVVANCTSVTYTPDSSFTGRDSCWYIICDNGVPVMCDTALLVITVNPNYALWPVAGFVSDSNNISDLFNCLSWQDAHALYRVDNNSINYDSTSWTFRSIDSNYCFDSTAHFSGDTITLRFDLLYACGFYNALEVCMTVYNGFGTNTKCDTICNIIWEGINEVQLSSIQIYPNPASNVLTIDMRNNNDEITRDYAALEIYNALGEKVKIVGNSSKKVVDIPVGDLSEGIYLATLLDGKGVRRTLGRFVKE